jgi:hypothetical protein
MAGDGPTRPYVRAWAQHDKTVLPPIAALAAEQGHALVWEKHGQDMPWYGKVTGWPVLSIMLHRGTVFTAVTAYNPAVSVARQSRSVGQAVPWVVASSAPDPNRVGKGMTVLARWPPCGGDRGRRGIGVGDVSQLLGGLGDQQRGPVHLLASWGVIRT